MGMEVFLQKEQEMPGTHKIGAAISGPGITDENYGHQDFFLSEKKGPWKGGPQKSCPRSVSDKLPIRTDEVRTL